MENVKGEMRIDKLSDSVYFTTHHEANAGHSIMVLPHWPVPTGNRNLDKSWKTEYLPHCPIGRSPANVQQKLSSIILSLQFGATQKPVVDDRMFASYKSY